MSVRACFHGCACMHMSLYGCVYLCIRGPTQALNMLRRNGSSERRAQSSAEEQVTDGREQECTW